MNSLVLLVAIAIQEPQVEPFLEYKVTRDGKPFGKAYLKNSRTEDRGFRTILTMMLQDPDGKVRVRTESVFDGDGKPLTKTQEIDVNAGKMVAKFAITFASDRAGVMLESSGRITKTEHPIDTSLPVADPTILWFRDAVPKVGEQRSYYTFNPTDMRWTLLTSQYVEKKEASFDGRRIEVHLIRTVRNAAPSDSWVEGDGTLVKFTGEGITMERVWSTRKSLS